MPGMPETSRRIAHVDMDAFYASVELRRRPELIGRPVLVGGATRGVVLSATYAARLHGIAGGMPMTRARRLCPEAIVVPPDFDAYTETSRGIRAIFESVLGSLGVPYAFEHPSRLGETPLGRAFVALLRYGWLGGGRGELFSFLRSPFSGLERRSVDFVEALPRTSTGKVLKRALRERHWAVQTRQVGGV